MIDRLESRKYLASAFFDGDFTLVVIGDESDDVISVLVDDQFDRTATVLVINTQTAETFTQDFDVPRFNQFSGFRKVRVIGGAGNDAITVFPLLGVDVEIYGDDVNTTTSDGNDTITGGAGGDPVFSGITTLFSTIMGGGGNDVVQLSGDARDFIDMGDGNDSVLASLGNDEIHGGAGNDVLSGDEGDDMLFGEAGSDTLTGGEGNDTMQGGAGADDMEGGIGFDWISYEDRTGANQSVWVPFDGVNGMGTSNLVMGVRTSTENDTVGPSADYPEGLILGNGNDTVDGQLGSASGSLWLIGGGGNDSLSGSDAGDDTIDGGLGNDTLRGFAGADSIRGGSGNDSIDGGAGEDVLFGDFNAAENPEEAASGGLGGDDFITGGDDNDIIDGEDGNDRLNGGPGDDSFAGGSDAVFDMFNVLVGYSGADTIDGGTGLDTVDYSHRTNPIRANFDSGPDDGEVNSKLNFGLGEADLLLSTTERVLGTSKNDTMTGTLDPQASHWFVGNGGNDLLTTGNAADTLDGGAGDDTLNGGLGADSVIGGPGTDSYTYFGRTSDINISFNNQPDDGAPGEGDNLQTVEILTTGSGADSIDGSLAPAALRVNAGSGNDTVRGSAFNDTLNGGSGINSVLGQAGDDTLSGGTGADEFFGGDGFDIVDYSAATAAVMVTFDDLANDGTANEGDNVHTDVEGFQGGNTPSLIDISNSPTGRRVTGGTGNDTVIGSAFNDTIDGGLGDDCIQGGDGNDYLIGGKGDDSLEGGNGNDRLLGGLGRDTLDGGAGNDTLIGAGGSDILIGGSGRDMASWYYDTHGVMATLDGKPNDGVPGENDDMRSDVENFQGGAGNDTMTGDAGRNAMDGGPGNDLLIGMNGKDTLYGNTGSDTLNGGSHDDVLIGAAGPDRLIGGNGLDTGDYSAYTVSVFLSLDNLANDGSLNEFDKIDRDVEILIGGSGNDSIVGGVLAETLIGGPGNDTLRGGILNDCLVGGTGFDQLFGEEGDDTLVGNDGQKDTLSGGVGSDSLLQDLGLDIIV